MENIGKVLIGTQKKNSRDPVIKNQVTIQWHQILWGTCGTGFALIEQIEFIGNGF